MIRWRKLVFVLTAVLLTTGLAWAEDKKDDALGDAAKREQIAIQAFQLEIRDALGQAEKLKGSDPAKALDVLRLALKKLETSSPLSIVENASLKVAVKSRIEDIENGKAKAEAEEAKKQAAELDRRITQLAADKERTAALQRDLDILKNMRQEGKLADAQKLADEIAKRHPNNVSANQQQQTTGAADRVREAKGLSTDKAVASNSALNDLARSSIPPKDDITYPKNFKDKDKRIEKYTGIPMTEKEKEIVKSLSEVIKTPTDIKDITFEKFLDDMQKALGQTILVNKGALKDLDISYERTFSVSLPKNVTRRSLLRTALAELGLTYVVRNEIIEVMDVERAKNCMTIRTMKVDDILAFGFNFPSGANGGKTNVDLLIDLIQDQVEPLSWQKYNGPGSITYYAPQGVLIIRNSAEVINMIGGGRSR